jgi:hypothetical protein
MMMFLLLIAFSPGERLEYVASFSFLNLGNMTLEIRDTITYQDHPCYHLSSLLSSSPGVSFLFTLNDTVDVYSTTEDLLPLYYAEQKHESNYHRSSRIRFNHDSLTACYDDTLTMTIEEKSRDVLSFWYFLRTIPLTVGDTIDINIHASRKNHAIPCYIARQEVIKTPLGEFNTVLVSPEVTEGIFGSGGGMDIWYSTDAQRYPVQIRAKMKVGSVLFKLKEIRH